MLRSNIVVSENEGVTVRVAGRKGSVEVVFPPVGDPIITVNTTDDRNREEYYFLETPKVEVEA